MALIPGYEYDIFLSYVHDDNVSETDDEDGWVNQFYKYLDTKLNKHSKKVKIWWDLTGTTIQEFKGHSGGIMSVAFSPDGKTILTGSRDNTGRLWKIAMPLDDFLKTDWSQPLSTELKEQYGIR